METPSIKYPFGNPTLPVEAERVARLNMVKEALMYLTE